VTINLNGFAIIGPNNCPIVQNNPSCINNGIPTAIGIKCSKDGATVTNGTIRGMGSYAIYNEGQNFHAENLNINNNGNLGILSLGIGIQRSAGSCLITRNSISNNFNGGINGYSCIITNNTVTMNGADQTGNGGSDGGITAHHGSLVSGNTINSNAMYGLNADLTTGYLNNVLINNKSFTQVNGGIQLGLNLCNGALCP
jgi:hypothetical protein